MAAANGPIKTLLALIIVAIIMCAVALYLIVIMGEAGGKRQVLVERTPVSMGFHDHRVDRWSQIDLA